MESGRISEIARTARLTQKEADIFGLIVEGRGDLVPRLRLLKELGGRAPRTLDTYIRNIRKKLTDAGFSDGVIQTSAGKGYAFKKNP